MPPPAAARRHNRRGRARKAPAPWERDWGELPADTILCVLHKLDQVDLLLGGVAAVCRSWRRAAREEPELWRHIDVPPFTRRGTLENVVRAALRFSAGQCDTFAAEGFDDDLFLLLAKQAPSLKRLQLVRYYPISNGGFANAIRKLPLLEELQLVSCHRAEHVLELVAKVCRRLEHFTLVRQVCPSYHYSYDRNAFAIATMHGLRSLTLVGDDLSNEGLTAIIDGCPRLEYLKMRGCRDMDMDYNLTAKCAHVFMDYYEYSPPSAPCSCCMPTI